MGSARNLTQGWWWRKHTHDVRFRRVRLVVFPSERLRLRGETAFASVSRFVLLNFAPTSDRSHARSERASERAACPGTEPTDLRFRSLATRLLSVAAGRSSPAQSTARRERVSRESNQTTVSGVGLTSFGTARLESGSACVVKDTDSLGIRTEFEHLSRQLDVPVVETRPGQLEPDSLPGWERSGVWDGPVLEFVVAVPV